jgi:hypothetical protein
LFDDRDEVEDGTEGEATHGDPEDAFAAADDGQDGVEKA